MTKRRFMKLIHLLSTGWFALWVGYVLILALRQAGIKWWVIFSLSGHSVILVLLLVSLYLFALFRGAARSQIIEQEHPLSSTDAYLAFYGLAPFLGGLAGILGGGWSSTTTTETLLGIAYGTMGATFLVWIIVDPAIGILESVLPASRRHRKERLDQVKKEREHKEQEREQLWARLETEEQERQQQRQKMLEPLSAKLLALISHDFPDQPEKEFAAIDIGLEVMRIDGQDAMKQLHELTMKEYQRQNQDEPTIDYISLWWDGIGGWAHKPLSEKGCLLGG